MTADGIQCGRCGYPRLQTIDTRQRPAAVRRIRKCVRCGWRCTTIEKVESTNDRHGTREAQQAAQSEPLSRDERQAAWAALRMVRDAIGELFGPVASIESEEAVLLRGPEYHHEAEAQITALKNIAEKMQ